MSGTRAQLLIGTYSESLPYLDGESEGIMGAEISPGGLDNPRVLIAARNPSSLVVTADGERIYAALEVTEFDDAPGGGVAAFQRDPETGELRLINVVPSGGVEPTHLSLDAAERLVAVANYRSGSITTFPVRADGGLGQRSSRVQHEGSGVHPVRQASPHPHQVVFDPQTGHLLVPDLGLDTIFVYRVHRDGGVEEIDRIAVPAGSGPRHLAFHPDGGHFFLVEELVNAVTVFRRKADSFEAIQTLSTLTNVGPTTSTASEIACSDSGETVLVSNRGDDSIALFQFDARTESLRLSALVSSEGSWPKGFGLIGTRLWVANLKSNSLDEFELDERAPSLRFVSRTSIPSPASVTSAPLR